MILNDILGRKRKEIEELKRRIPLPKIKRMISESRVPKRSLYKVLSNTRKLNLICELKKASPSEGLLREHFQPAELAQNFEAAGASAISVLTEQNYFQGNPETLKQIRPMTTVPLLRKDFILDPYQIYETTLLEADAVLLIVTILTDSQLKRMLLLARELDLEVLVEVHTEEELNRALGAGARMVGLNNRNLKTLKIDRSVSEDLIHLVPKGTVVVIESGIETREEIAHYQTLGANSFLIGTALMKSTDVKRKILELMGQPNGVAQ